jgi:hypothetical protein
MKNLSHTFARTPAESAPPADVTTRAPSAAESAAWVSASLGVLAGALAPAATSAVIDDAALAAIPRGQIMAEVEAAEAAIKRASSPKQRAAARKRLEAVQALARAWARATVATIAIKYAGTSARNQPDRYLEILVGPGDDAKTREEMLAWWSSRLLFARGVLRKLGVEDECFERNYSGDAARDVEAAACRRRAWVCDTFGTMKGNLPQKGDVVELVDGQPHRYNPKTGDPIYREYLIVVVGTRPDPKNPRRWLVATVEGGHGPGGREIRAFGVAEPGASKALRRPRVIERLDDGSLWMDQFRIDGWVDSGLAACPAPPCTGDKKKSAPRARAAALLGLALAACAPEAPSPPARGATPPTSTDARADGDVGPLAGDVGAPGAPAIAPADPRSPAVAHHGGPRR